MNLSDFNENLQSVIKSYMPLQLNDKNLRKEFGKEFLRIEKEYFDKNREEDYELYIINEIDKFIRKLTINRFEGKNFYIRESKIRFIFGKSDNDRIYYKFISEGILFSLIGYKDNKKFTYINLRK